MAGSNDLSTTLLQSVAFVGETLAPLFLQDPETGSAGEMLEAFRTLDVDAAVAEWPFADRESARSGLAQMVEGLCDGITNDLVWEYRRLFVGPGHKAAAPWGSVYTDHDGVIFGESALALHRWMAANGVERRGNEGDPDDHIGLMLALMSWIARNRPELLHEYLEFYLLTWAPHYLEKLGCESTHPLYIGVADLTASTLEGVRETFGITIEKPRFYR